jgi:hypothetical protein
MRARLLVLSLIAALTLQSDAVGAVTIKGTLNATVGPGFTITLKRSTGVVVTSLKAGTWKFVVDDKSSVHNFHLTGPGSVNKTTTVKQITKVTWTVTVKPGTYTYKCDPHATQGMKKTFKVVA